MQQQQNNNNDNSGNNLEKNISSDCNLFAIQKKKENINEEIQDNKINKNSTNNNNNKGKRPEGT